MNITYINLENYDIKYDLQYMKLMVLLLEQYILFKRPSEMFQNTEVQIFQKNKSIMKLLSIQEYIHFIQYEFPQLIKNDIIQIEEKLFEEEVKKDILSNKNNTKPYFKLPIFISEDTRDYYEQITDELNQLNKDNIKIIENNNKEEIKSLQSLKGYLHKINTMNQEKNGSINSVLDFIKNLNYLNIQELYI